MIETLPKKYRTQEQRFLYVIFQRFGNFSKVARYLGLHRQTVYDIMEGKRKLSLEHAYLLSHRVALPTHLFVYRSYVIINPEALPTYSSLIKSCSSSFDRTELKYILDGKSPPSPHEILQEIHNEK